MNMEQDSEFKWGKRASVESTNKDVQYYQSFTYYGVEYSLYDCVYLYQSGALETDIGKIIRIWSKATEKKIRVVWLFRPAEIRDFLGDYDPQWNEVFLASGKGTGVSNVNPLEAIVGKCNVVCRLKDPKNPRPSKEELRTANYIFLRTFNVDRCKISQKFPDEICRIKVEKYFNRPKQQSCSRIPTSDTHLKDQAGPSNPASNPLLEKEVAHPVKNGNLSRNSIPIVKESRNWARPELRDSLRDQAEPLNVLSDLHPDKLVSCPVMNVKRNAVDSIQPPVSTSDTHCLKKIKTADDTIINHNRLPDIDKSGWFKTGLWEERLRAADNNGTLVLLQNLDPSTASSEVKDRLLSYSSHQMQLSLLYLN